MPAADRARMGPPAPESAFALAPTDGRGRVESEPRPSVEQAFLEHHDTLLRFVRRMARAYRLPDPHYDAEDIVQSVFVQALGQWPKQTIDHPQAWLYKVARVGLARAAAAAARQGVPVAAPELDDAGVARWTSATPFPQAEEQHAVRRIFDAIAGLPHRQRVVVYLQKVEGWSTQEIAELLECSRGTIFSHTHRGVAAVRVQVNRSEGVGQYRSERAGRMGARPPKSSDWPSSDPLGRAEVRPAGARRLGRTRRAAARRARWAFAATVAGAAVAVAVLTWGAIESVRRLGWGPWPVAALIAASLMLLLPVAAWCLPTHERADEIEHEADEGKRDGPPSAEVDRLLVFFDDIRRQHSTVGEERAVDLDRRPGRRSNIDPTSRPLDEPQQPYRYRGRHRPAGPAG